MRIDAKYFESQRNLILAQLEQAKTHHLIKDNERPDLIEAYEAQLKRLELQEQEYINSIEVEFEEVKQ